MKKLILLLVILFSYTSLFAQLPLVRFYLNNGNMKEYKIEDIMNMNFIHSNLSYSMTVFQKGNIKTEIDIREIVSVLFERTADNSKQLMKIVRADESNTFDISDIDSIIFVFNTCEEIQIGTQIWMCRNLDVDHYRNGDSIPEVRDSADWANPKSGAWCYYKNDPEIGKIYGKLYNWYAVNDPRGLAPKGWHIPSDDELTTLTKYLGGDSVAGGKLKEAGTVHWAGNEGATNESGFTALPGGWRNFNGPFNHIDCICGFWLSTECSSTSAWNWYLDYYSNDVRWYYNYKEHGISVRCVRDK